jgi:hypothetical protein
VLVNADDQAPYAPLASAAGEFLALSWRSAVRAKARVVGDYVS